MTAWRTTTSPFRHRTLRVVTAALVLLVVTSVAASAAGIDLPGTSTLASGNVEVVDCTNPDQIQRRWHVGPSSSGRPRMSNVPIVALDIYAGPDCAGRTVMAQVVLRRGTPGWRRTPDVAVGRLDEAGFVRLKGVADRRGRPVTAHQVLRADVLIKD